MSDPTEDERLKCLRLLARKIWIDSIKEQCTRKAEHWQWHDETCPFAASQKKRGEAPDVDKRLSDEYSRGWHDGFSSADAGRLEHKLHAPRNELTAALLERDELRKQMGEKYGPMEG